MTDSYAMLEKTAEIEDTFSYDGYQIARREMFAHLREPAVTIRKDSITFNTACINGLEDVVYIQILVNSEDHRLAIRECDENDKDAIRWCIAKPDKRKTRKITSKPFSQKIYDLMGWDTGCRYKILGHRISYEGEVLYVFELNETEITKERKRKTKEQVLAEAENSSLTPEQIQEREDEAQRMAKTPFYPDDWHNSFGVPVEEHSNVTLETIDGFNLYGSNNTEKEKKE